MTDKIEFINYPVLIFFSIPGGSDSASEAARRAQEARRSSVTRSASCSPRSAGEEDGEVLWRYLSSLDHAACAEKLEEGWRLTRAERLVLHSICIFGYRSLTHRENKGAIPNVWNASSYWQDNICLSPGVLRRFFLILPYRMSYITQNAIHNSNQISGTTIDGVPLNIVPL